MLPTLTQRIPTKAPPKQLVHGPGAVAAESLRFDPDHVPRRWVRHRRELDVRAHVDVGEALQQLRCSATLDSRFAVHDEVFLQPWGPTWPVSIDSTTRGSCSMFCTF